jgi:cell division protein FtsB
MVLVAAVSAPVAGFSALSTPASADSVSELRSSIDHVAEKWFAAQGEVQELDAKIAANEQHIKDLDAHARVLKVEATARAVDMYVGKPTRLVDVFSEGTVIDSARRVELIEQANEKSAQTFESLTDMTNELKSQRDALTEQRDAKRDALESLSQLRSSLDAQLDEARQAAAARATRPAAKGTGSDSGADSTAGSSGGGDASEPATIVIAAPPAPAGVHPMHDHPFLVCTRNRESRGDYQVVSSSGLYYGAYQFLRTTWDATANHAGRNDLVGVLPNTASAYDQDDLAWALYQWQGTSPWGGRC